MQLKKNPQMKPKLKQWSKRLLVLLLAGGMLLGLTACEESLAFVEYQYWYDVDDIDPDVDPAVDNNEDNEDETEEKWIEKEVEDSERTGIDESVALYDDSVESTEDDSESVQADYNDDSMSVAETEVASNDATVSEDSDASSASGTDNPDGAVTEGNDGASKTTGGTGVASDQGDSTLGESEEDSNQTTSPGIDEDEDNEDSDLNAGNNDDNDETGTEGDNGSASNDGGESGSRSDEDTQQVVSCGTVIATGEAAILVQMLGGQGALYATDQTTYNELAEYFPEEELEDIEILWSGDSTGSVDTDSLDALIADGKTPQAALLDSTALNSSDVSALTGRGISCTALSFDSYDDIKSSVNTAAAVLGTDEATQMQQEYLSFCDSITEMVGEYESEKYTLFVSEWDSSAQLSFNGNVTGSWKSRKGLAVASKLSYSPMDELWELAGIGNIYSEAGEARREGSGGLAVLDYEYVYLNQFWLLYLGSNYKVTGDYLIEYCDNILLYNLGTEDYPAVVTATQAIQSSWLEDKNYSSETQDGGMYTVYPRSVGDGSYRCLYNNGRKDSAVLAYIDDEYEVYVNPDGLGDWAEGSAESILETIWVAWRIQGTCTEAQVREKIQEYYATFYRHNLTESEVDTILAGKES